MRKLTIKIQRWKIMKKILTVIGTRPEIIKMSRLISLLDEEFDHKFIFTSQHYSMNMVDVFFEEMKIRKPDFLLGVNSSEYEYMIKPLQSQIESIDPDYVLVHGDTNSTLAAAIAAKSCNKKLIHVEAGLRSFDKKMPEEINRILTDHMSDYLFTPTELTKSYLEKEGITKNVFVVGNTIVDVCNHYSENQTNRINPLKKYSLDENKYILLTMHRQENVDNPKILSEIITALTSIKSRIIFPIHPRTKNNLRKYNCILPENVMEIEPLGYLDFLQLEKNASLIITDSGGVQEEAITFNVPCLTIRTSTERLETILNGGNLLVGTNPELIRYYIEICLSNLGNKMRTAINPYGNGKTSETIVKILSD